LLAAESLFFWPLLSLPSPLVRALRWAICALTAEAFAFAAARLFAAFEAPLVPSSLSSSAFLFCP
jgi:hypothetical protein